MPSISAMSSSAVIPAQYSDGLSAAIVQVHLSLRDGVLHISGPGLSRAWPCRGVRVLTHIDGAPLVLGFKGSDERLTIASDDEDMLREWFPVLLDRDRRRQGTLLLGGTLTALAAGVVAFAIFGLPGLADRIADRVPLDVEARMGERTNGMVSLFTAECTHSEDARITLDRIAADLTAASGSPFDIQIRIVDADFPNAFAMPGGYVVVTDELMAMMDTPEQLFGVLAHEAAHVAERHVMAAQVREMGAGVLLELLVGGGSGAGQELARAGATVESMRHTRSAEYEADALALDYLETLDVNPEGLAEFFDIIDAFVSEPSLESATGSARETTDSDTDSKTDSGTDSASSVDSGRNDSGRNDSGRNDSGRNTAWIEGLLSTHPNTAERARDARTAAVDIRWSGTPALTDTQWSVLQAVCTNEDDTAETPLKSLGEAIEVLVTPAESESDPALNETDQD